MKVSARSVIYGIQGTLHSCGRGCKVLYWITGLAGAGKTTIGKALYKRLIEKNPAVVFLDGDDLRAIVGGRFGYTLEERRECSMFYSRLCKYLTDQGLDVICCVCAMLESVRSWNRENIDDYLEVFVNPNMEVLRARNQKGLYADLKSDVYGTTLQPDLPLCPDVILDNDGSVSIEEQIEMIMKGAQT